MKHKNIEMITPVKQQINRNPSASFGSQSSDIHEGGRMFKPSPTHKKINVLKIGTD